jgi:hypothetical protein
MVDIIIAIEIAPAMIIFDRLLSAEAISRTNSAGFK